MRDEPVFLLLFVAISLRKIFPTYTWLAKFIIKAASILLLLSFFLILIENFHAFAEFTIQAYILIIFATICAFASGVIFSGRNTKKQVSLRIEASLRNPGLAYLIAVENLPLERVDLAMVPYVFCLVLVVILCTIALKQLHKSIG